MNNEEDFIVKKHSAKDLYIVKYRHSGIDWSQPHALDARGIVLDGDSNVVARPYKKFFNYNELRHREDLPREIKRLSYWNSGDYVVMEKLDGSLAVVSQYKGELLFSSSGNIEGEYPELFQSWFEKNLTKEQMSELKMLTGNHTLIFEYVSPETRIVVPYQEAQMILHGIIHTETGNEINLFDKPSVFRFFAESIGVDTPHVFNITLEQVLRIKEQDFGEDILEGFVVQFKSGKRLKIKTDEYVKRHFDYTIAFGRIDTKRKIELFIQKIEDGTIDDIIAILEEKRDLTSVKFINDLMAINTKFNKLVLKAKKVVEVKTFDKKEYVLTYGHSELFDKLVLNIQNEFAIERIKRDYIKDELEKRKENE